MLQILSDDEKFGFEHIVTGDESWFFYDYPLRTYWAAASEPPREVPKRTISTAKVMFVVFWGVNNTPVQTFVEKGKTVTAKLFNEMVISKLDEWNDTLSVSETLVVHWDNAAPHRAQIIQQKIHDSGFKKMPQPPYSPDIVPSDFFLFGFLKKKLEGKKCETREKLLEEIKNIMATITPKKRSAVFLEWMRRLREVISSNGEYISG
jgi:hypothetical protein